MATSVYRDRRGLLVLRDLKAIQDRRDILGPRAKRVIQVRKVLSALQDHPVQKATRVIQEYLLPVRNKDATQIRVASPFPNEDYFFDQFWFPISS